MQAIYLTLDGETHTIPEWSKITGISAQTLRQRRNMGWPAEAILKTPTQNRGPAGARTKVRQSCGRIDPLDCLQCPYEKCINMQAPAMPGESYREGKTKRRKDARAADNSRLEAGGNEAAVCWEDMPGEGRADLRRLLAGN